MYSSYPRTRTFRQSIVVTLCALVVWASVALPAHRGAQISSSGSIFAGGLLAATVVIQWNSWGAPELLG
jgi:hypothetical protein